MNRREEFLPLIILSVAILFVAIFLIASVIMNTTGWSPV